VTTSRASRRWAYALLAFLLLLRVPSLVQPAGADQGLYAYVGSRILDGELPYRDAWDQKPPAIHFMYALMYSVWPDDAVVAAADLLAAAAIAWLLVPLGTALGGTAGAGFASAAVFLALGDPTFSRLAGVRLRAQCETFIAVAVTAAILLAIRTARHSPPGAGSRTRHRLAVFAAGVCVGVAVVFKYNAAVYAPVALAALWLAPAARAAWRKDLLTFCAGCAAPAAGMLVLFAAGGALYDLYQATVAYNLQYSGQTYDGPWSGVRYVLTFPVAQARIDSLWTIGGLGCLVLLAAGLRRGGDLRLLFPVLWTCAACLSIAINGSRGLPQYFVQAAPPLGLAAGVAAALLWPAPSVSSAWRAPLRLAVLLLVAFGAWRVTDFDKLPRNAAHDLAYAAGRISREDHLARYGGQRDDKYAALSQMRLAEYLRARTPPSETVYIFGFSPGAYVLADRVSASRFFWSFPIIAGFNASAPGYGPGGVLEDLRASSPRYVVLQLHDWAPPELDSAGFFLGHPRLGAWLREQYHRTPGPDEEDYEVWVRNDAAGPHDTR
jgi:hypothetical protein